MRIRLLPGLCWLLYCWAAYTVLVIFFIRFADLQHYGYTSWHGFLVLLDALLLHWYWPGFSPSPKASAFKMLLAIVCAPLWLIPWLGRRLLAKCAPVARLQLALLWLSNAAAVWVLVMFACVQAHIEYGSSKSWIKQGLAWEGETYGRFGLHLVPRLSVAGFKLTLPDKFFEVARLQHPEKSETALWQEAWNTLDLSGRRLAFADFKEAQLPHSTLFRAKLQGANLGFANLQGADLRSAQWQGANLEFAELQGAYLKSAHLQGAKLMAAQLQGAVLGSAQLQSAFLGHAHLQGANLDSADLHYANLEDANLQGANLDSADLQYANLEDANLQGANLEDADLQRAKLDSADLHYANLKDANLQGALLIYKELKGVHILEFQQLESTWTGAKERLATAQQSQKNFKPLQLPPPITKEKFTTIWLNLLCQEAEMTKGMLNQLRLGFDKHPITKPQAQTYLNNTPGCEPYRKLLDRLAEQGKSP